MPKQLTMAGSPAGAVTLEQYGELEVKVIKLRRALAHAQSVTKRQDAALSKTIDRLQTLDEEVKELKEEGSRLEEEIHHFEAELTQRRNLPEMSQKDFTEKEIIDARREIDDLAFEGAKVLVECEKQKLCNREVGKTVEIIKKRYEHEGKKRRHEIRGLDEKETVLRNEIDKLKREKNQLVGGGASRDKGRSTGTNTDSRRSPSRVSRGSASKTTTTRSGRSPSPRANNSRTSLHRNNNSAADLNTSRRSSDRGGSYASRKSPNDIDSDSFG